MSKDSIIEKIQKLLSKTIENGCSQEEAAAALALAQQLMAKYNISSSECVESEIVSEVQVSVGTKRVSSRQAIMAMDLAKHFGCAVYRSRKRSGDTLVFVGEGDKPAVLKEAFNFAYKSYQLCWTAFHKTLSSGKEQCRNDYFHGFLNGIISALEYNENKYSIVLCKSEQVDKFVDEKTSGKVHNVAAFGQGIYFAESRGYQDGYESQVSKGTRLHA